MCQCGGRSALTEGLNLLHPSVAQLKSRPLPENEAEKRASPPQAHPRSIESANFPVCGPCNEMAGWLVKIDGSLNLEFHMATIPNRSHDNRRFQSVVTADFCRRRTDEGPGFPRQHCSGTGGWSGGSHDRSSRVEPRAEIADVTARGDK